MLTTNPAGTAYVTDDLAGGVVDSSASGVSWAAIFAGGVTASAVSVILLIFGTGLGLYSVSPWAGSGVSAPTFTVLAAIWLVVVQWVSSGFGGYMAGRLRTKWTGVHTDEVFFRDTAHGFLAWALATIIAVGVLSSATTSAVSGGAHLGAAVMANAANTSSNNYYVDELFRQTVNPAAAAPNGTSVVAPTDDNGSAAMVTGLSDQETRSQASVILAQDAATGTVSSADNAYLVQLVSSRTGLSPTDAQTRVNDVLAQEQAAAAKTKQIADAARKASASAMVFTFVSLLIGAFIASVSGAIGGRLRDNY
jgi:hypothetical protein